MHGYHAFVLTVACLLCGVNSVISTSRELICTQYYTSGENYNLNELPSQMYGVYFWPPKERQRDSCEKINFRKLQQEGKAEASYACSKLSFPAEETVMEATYTNNAGKPVRLFYYGDAEVKNMYRGCDKNIAKYIFKKVNDNYILGINCSASGRGILYSTFLPSFSEVQNVVNSIEIMGGREGSPDCSLSR